MTTAASASQVIDFTLDGSIAIATLNRPHVRNAVDQQMRAELRAVVQRVAEDKSLRGLVITGAGTAFCSGGDVRGMQERLAAGQAVGEQGWRRQRELHETLTKLHFLDRPTIAAVNGAAFGLGLDLALTCDFIFASEAASFSAGFIHRGLVPDGGGLYYLPRRGGLPRAQELIFSGRRGPAAEAPPN